MYHSQVNEYKYEIERLNRELQDLKSKYYQLRKKHQADKRALQSAKETVFQGYDEHGHDDRLSTYIELIVADKLQKSSQM
jgi:uncharacterized coiled-coil DUF342 family protein